jgi:hypothetical protein
MYLGQDRIEPIYPFEIHPDWPVIAGLLVVASIGLFLRFDEFGGRAAFSFFTLVALVFIGIWSSDFPAVISTAVVAVNAWASCVWIFGLMAPTHRSRRDWDYSTWSPVRGFLLPGIPLATWLWRDHESAWIYGGGLAIGLPIASAALGAVGGILAERTARAKQETEALAAEQQRAKRRADDERRRETEAEHAARREAEAEAARQRRLAAEAEQQAERDRIEEAERRRRETAWEQRQAEMARRNAMEEEQRDAIADADLLDEPLSVQDHLRRDHNVIGQIYRRSGGRIDNPVPLSQLAEDAGLTLGQAVKCVLAAEQTGHVEVRLNDDRSSWWQQSIFLTSEGKEWLSRMSQPPNIHIEGHGNVIGPNNRVITTVNQNLAARPDREAIADALALLRAEIDELDVANRFKRTSQRAIEDAEDELATEEPDPDAVQSSLARVTETMERAGETYDAASGWAHRLREAVRVIGHVLPQANDWFPF